MSKEPKKPHRPQQGTQPKDRAAVINEQEGGKKVIRSAPVSELPDPVKNKTKENKK
jgi:hypothetical protein